MLDSPRLRSLKDLTFHSDFAKKLWITIFTGQELAANTENIAFLTSPSTVGKSVEKPANTFAELVAGINWPKYFLPIRFFRSSTTALLNINSTALTFLSSGTTSGPEGRSKSLFSADGVAMYRGTSLLAFARMLIHRSGHDNFGGVSLVPPPSDWPDSSLARMIQWLSEYWDVSYANYLDFDAVAAAVKKAGLAGSRPVFVFGTAFHLIDFLDQNLAQVCALPPGSIVIETGGTKGRTRSVTRAELYALIADGFGITQDQIVSEYGMCELASQAYDVVQFGESKSLSERRFRFPDWAPVQVMREHSEGANEGEGALLIWDKARLDIAAPIQVEDLAKLDADGGFQLIGRIPTAPLKGCSLKVDEILNPTSVSQTFASKGITEIAIKDIGDRAERVAEWLAALAGDALFASRLTEEFGSNVIASHAINDLRRSLPLNAEAVENAVKEALAGRESLAASWIVIPPSTHSIAALQPLALLLAAGADVKLRLTSIIGQTGSSSSLTRISELLHEHRFPVSTLPSSWKIKSPQDVGNDAILMFGDNATIAQVSHVANTSVVAFGNALSATLTYADELGDPQTIAKLVRDNIALSQRGCMSSRINLVVGELGLQSREDLITALRLALRDKASIDTARYVARSLEVVRLQQAGGRVERFGTVDGLVCFFENPLNVQTMISKQELNFIFHIASEQTIATSEPWGAALGEIKKLSASNGAQRLLDITPALTRQIQVVPLGTLNAAPFNGLHLGLPVFS